MTILPDLTTETETPWNDIKKVGHLSEEQFESLQRKLDAALVDNERLRRASQSKLNLKVTEKGGVAVYGLGRFPLTLYLSQWEKLFESIESIKAFVEANREQLTVKE